MSLLILGLAVFLGAHLIVTFRECRAELRNNIGEGPYKGLFSLVSAVGLGLIVYGFGAYRAGGYIPVWEPPRFLAHVSSLLMVLSFIALAAAYAPAGAIKRRLKHPMLVAVKIWALAHLLVNGDLGSMILFGSFLAWAVYDRIALKRREVVEGARWQSIPPGFAKGDVVAIVVGLAVAVIFALWLHAPVIGVPVIAR